MKPNMLLVFVLLLVVVPAEADQVTLDDAIINGSMCVGLDCANGEVFGFSTIVVKENNVRIYFQDTSNSAAFPTTDWQLVANDSNNGGRNRFSIEDVTAQTEPFTVLGGAPSGALLIDGAGRVGVGTTTPASSLHVTAPDTPNLRLEQSTTAGWPGYAWEAAANEASLRFVDVTAGTQPVRIENGAVDDALVVHADGNVTIAGTLTQGSSRAIKHVSALDANDVLARVKALEVSEWRYRNDTRGSAHIGPMAEDFYAAFGLGADDRHIAASDVAGVAVAAVQALSATVDSQRAELDELRRRNRDLEARLQRIEALLPR